MICDEIGLELLAMTRHYLLRRNEQRQYDCSYHKCLDVKKCHYAAKKEHICIDLEQKVKDAKEGMDYGPSIDINDVAGLAVNKEQGNVKSVEAEYNSHTLALETSNSTGKK